MFRLYITLLIFIFSSSFTFCQQIIKFGIYVKTLKVNNEGEFYADFYWWLKIPNNNLLDSVQLSQISDFEIVNAKNDLIKTIDLSSINSNLNKYYIYGTCKGTFKYKPDFTLYPLDTQKIDIIIENPSLEKEKLIYVNDDSSYVGDHNGKIGIEEEFNAPDSKIVGGVINEISNKVYYTTFGDPKLTKESTYSRLTYKIKIVRKSGFYFQKILVPCVLLLIISYLVFFIRAKDLEVAVGCTVTSVLACIAIQLVIADDLPAIGYITLADKLFYFFYFMMSYALVQTVFSYNLERNEKKELSNKLEKISRWLFPIVSIIGILLICNGYA